MEIAVYRFDPDTGERFEWEDLSLDPDIIFELIRIQDPYKYCWQDLQLTICGVSYTGEDLVFSLANAAGVSLFDENEDGELEWRSFDDIWNDILRQYKPLKDWETQELFDGLAIDDDEVEVGPSRVKIYQTIKDCLKYDGKDVLEWLKENPDNEEKFYQKAAAALNCKYKG